MRKLAIFAGSLVLALGLILAPAAALTASAAEFITPSDKQGNVSTSASESHRNLFVAGGSVTIGSITQGDLFVAGGNVVIEGNVEQDLFVAGGNVTINGLVGGDIRAAGGNLLINNSVSGDVMVAGGSVNISEKATVGGDLISGTGELIVNGSIAGKVKSGGGVLTLNSNIGGTVEIYADESLTIGSKAIIASPIQYQGVQEASVQDGAQIREINFQMVEQRRGDASKALAAIITITFFVKIIAMIIAGLILMKLFPRTSRNAVMKTTENPWINLGIGALMLVVVPLLALLVIITFVGFYVAVLAFMAYLLLLVLAALVASVFAGSLVLRLVTKRSEWQVNWQALVTGVIVLSLLYLVPILGCLLIIIVVLMAAGAMLRLLYGHILQEQATNIPY